VRSSLCYQCRGARVKFVAALPMPKVLRVRLSSREWTSFSGQPWRASNQRRFECNSECAVIPESLPDGLSMPIPYSPFWRSQLPTRYGWRLNRSKSSCKPQAAAVAHPEGAFHAGVGPCEDENPRRPVLACPEHWRSAAGCGRPKDHGHVDKQNFVRQASRKAKIIVIAKAEGRVESAHATYQVCSSNLGSGAISDAHLPPSSCQMYLRGSGIIPMLSRCPCPQAERASFMCGFIHEPGRTVMQAPQLVLELVERPKLPFEFLWKPEIVVIVESEPVTPLRAQYPLFRATFGP